MQFRRLKSLSFILLSIVSLWIVEACQPTSKTVLGPTNALETSLPTAPKPTEPESFRIKREQMVEQQILARGISDEAVLEAMRVVPRHLFVPEDMIPFAYDDRPLPIGYGQTISQPYIVALMTESLQVKPGDKVLEIGTGSGYQAAILAELKANVYTIEIIPELATQAEERLTSLGYEEIHVRNADGYFGWAEEAPFDEIIVTAAPDHLPQPLAAQLKDGGRLIIPIGPVGFIQTLWLFEKIEDELQATNLGSVMFVPLTGIH